MAAFLSSLVQNNTTFNGHRAAAQMKKNIHTEPFLPKAGLPHPQTPSKPALNTPSAAPLTTRRTYSSLLLLSSPIRSALPGLLDLSSPPKARARLRARNQTPNPAPTQTQTPNPKIPTEQRVNPNPQTPNPNPNPTRRCCVQFQFDSHTVGKAVCLCMLVMLRVSRDFLCPLYCGIITIYILRGIELCCT